MDRLTIVKKKKRPKAPSFRASFRTPCRTSYYYPQKMQRPHVPKVTPTISYNNYPQPQASHYRTQPLATSARNVTVKRNPGVQHSQPPNTILSKRNFALTGKSPHAGLPSITFKAQPKYTPVNEPTVLDCVKKESERIEEPKSIPKEPEPINRKEKSVQSRFSGILERLQDRKSRLCGKTEIEQKATGAEIPIKKEDMKISVNSAGTERKVEMKYTLNDSWRHRRLNDSSDSSDSWTSTDNEEKENHTICLTKKSPREIQTQRKLKSVIVSTNNFERELKNLKKISSVNEIDTRAKALVLNDDKKKEIANIRQNLGLKSKPFTKSSQLLDEIHIDIRKNYINDAKHQIDAAEIVTVSFPQSFAVHIFNITSPSQFDFQFGLDDLNEMTDDMA
jgi:Ni,Fe-hydrogenase III component G